MARFIFGIGTGIAAQASPGIIAPGLGIRILKTLAFSESQGIPQGRDISDDFETINPLQETSDVTSYLGTPVLDPFTFVGSNFFDIDDPTEQNPIPYPDAKGPAGQGLIIHNAIIEVSQAKNIITTPIQGRDGTVKEFVSRGDYLITLSGIISGKMDEETGEIASIGNVYPQDDVNKLITICDIPGSIEVRSDFLGMFLKEDSRVVITDYNIPQQIGVRDHQVFTINMLSDTPIQLNELTPVGVLNIETRVPADPIIIGVIDIFTVVRTEPIIIVGNQTPIA